MVVPLTLAVSLVKPAGTSGSGLGIWVLSGIDRSPWQTGSAGGTERSVEVELVALDVLHHEARIGAVVQKSHAYRAEREQPGALGLQRGQALFAHQPGPHPDVEVHPVLDDLPFGNA